jgi:hypothetical protein
MALCISEQSLALRPDTSVREPVGVCYEKGHVIISMFHIQYYFHFHLNGKYCLYFLKEGEKEGVYICRKHKFPHEKHSRRRKFTEEFQNIELASVRQRNRYKTEVTSIEADIENEETVWLGRDEHQESLETNQTEFQSNHSNNNNRNEINYSESKSSEREMTICPEAEVEVNLNAIQCKTRNELLRRKFIVAEWQRIATVIDRILFWFYFLGTLTSYLVILIFVPNSKYSEWSDAIEHNKDDLKILSN